MLHPLLKRSLPIAITLGALTVGVPLTAQSEATHSTNSYSHGTYDMNDSYPNTRARYDHRRHSHQRDYYRDRDYYTDQYRDLDNDQNNRRSRRGDIHSGTTKLHQDELRQLDRELREDIRNELAYSPFVDEEKVRVKVRRGVATLTGTVEDRSAMVAAVENAYEGGARKVVNKLRVNRHEERPWREFSDSRLESEIYDELEEGISVDVRDGVATLRGTVDDRSAMADAVEETYDVGARRVINKLRLRN